MALGRCPLSIFCSCGTPPSVKVHSVARHFHQLPRCLFQYRVQGPAFRVQGSGFRVQGSGCRVQGAGFHSKTIRPYSVQVQSRGLNSPCEKHKFAPCHIVCEHLHRIPRLSTHKVGTRHVWRRPPCALLSSASKLPVSGIQGYLAHKTPPSRRTLQ